MVRTAKITSGFTLLEVLVALFVLSVGLLGLAALQTIALKFNTQSYMRTQATLQLYDIVDRMRANRDAAGTVNVVYSTEAPMGAKPGAADCASTACSAADLARYDIRQWNTANAQLLAQGEGAIRKTGSIYTITIQWKENDLPMALNLEAQL